MNIGIFGGTFNPPHNGHLIIGEHVRERMRLDRILFIPSAISPHKQREETVSSRDRLEMVRLAIQGNERFAFSDVEIVRGGVSYTVDTLQELCRTHPRDHFHLLIGLDNLPEFHSWKDPQRILELADVVVMSRPDFTPHSVDPAIVREVTTCTVPEIGISSREIRRRVKEGKSIRYLVPPDVEGYIRKRGLYR